MKAVLQTIQAIRAALKEGAPLSSSPKAAGDYVLFCSEAERRLETVAMMLQKGSDYQAFQVAEEEPPLLDLIAALSFGGEKSWQALCERHSLPTAPLLNARTVRDLEDLYAKGISASHPLYKDFRSAVLSRDDDRALRIVRTILKLNPGDDNARKEMERLQHKRMQEMLEQLRAALKTDDEERIATLTESLQASAPAATLERHEVYENGEAIRRALRRRQARDKLPGLMAEMQALQTGGDWRSLSALLENTQVWLKEHAINPADEAWSGKLTALNQYVQREKGLDEKRRQFDKAVQDFVAFAAEVETRLSTGAGLTYAEITQKDETFVRKWKELETFQLPVEQAVQQRLKAAGVSLRAKLEGMHSAARTRKIAKVAAVVLALAVVLGVAGHAWKANALTQELAGYQAQGACVPAEMQIATLRHDKSLLLQWPFLEAKVVEVSGWAAQARSTEKQAEEALLPLEKSFADGRSSLPPQQLVRQLADASAVVKQVAADLLPPLKNRLATLQTRVDLQLEGLQTSLKSSTTTELTAVEQLAETKLAYTRSAAQTGDDWRDLNTRVVALEALLQPATSSLELPAAIATRIKALRQRLDAFKNDLEAFKRARELATTATTLKAYKEALAKWRDLRFTEAAPAIKALATFPEEAAVQAALLTSGDEDVLKAVLNDASGRNMAPASPVDTDKSIILALMTDTNLNDVWENTVLNYGREKTTTQVWSSGKPRNTGVGSSVRSSGSFYDPETNRSALFLNRDYLRVGEPGKYQGAEVTFSKLSATSEFMQILRINRMTDDDGTRILLPLLEVFDTLARDKICPPVAKAYVMLRLERMTASRPYSWGMHYCPTLQADLRQLATVLAGTTLRSEDWLDPATRDRLTPPLAEFYKTFGSRSYMKEAVARRDFVRDAALAGVKFGGYVETDLSLVLTQAARTAGELWVLAKDDGKPLLLGNPASSTSPAKATGAAPLSPIFFVPVDRRHLLQRYAETMSTTSQIKPHLGDALLLTAPAL